MSVIKVNNITNRDGTSGPVFAGITTVSSTSHMVVPTGHTGQRVGLAPDPFINNLVLALPFNSESVFSDISPKNNQPMPTGLGTTTASLPFGVSGVTTTSSGIVTFSKYYGTSAYFNGSSTYINTSGLSVNSSTFTVEFWVNFYAFNGVPIMTSTSSRGGIAIYFPNSSTLNFVGGTASGSWNIDTNITVSLVTGTWYHFAVVRNGGGTFDIYKDGILLSSVSSVSITHGELSLGRQGGDNNLYFNGYIQDLRIYSGLAKYTSNFTPPNQIAI